MPSESRASALSMATENDATMRAMAVQNAFDILSRDVGGEAGPTLSPEHQEALVNAMLQRHSARRIPVCR